MLKEKPERIEQFPTHIPEKDSRVFIGRQKKKKSSHPTRWSLQCPSSTAKSQGMQGRKM